MRSVTLLVDIITMLIKINHNSIEGKINRIKI